MATRLNDPGLITREFIYSKLGRSQDAKVVERSLRRFCHDDVTPDHVERFLESYNAYFTSYRTVDAGVYEDQFIFYFTPTKYTQLSIFGDRLERLMVEAMDTMGNSGTFKRLEKDINKMQEEKDDILYALRENPILMETMPSLVFLFEKNYPGEHNDLRLYNFIGVFDGAYRSICHSR